MDPPTSMVRSPRSSPRFGLTLNRILRPCLLGTALAGSACARAGHPPAIAYSDPSVGRNVGRVAQAAIDEWQTPPAVEVRLNWSTAAGIRSGYAGDIDFGEAMVALPGLVAAIGPLSSRATLLVAPIYAERRIPLISATATTSKLRSASEWVFLLPPVDSEEGDYMAAFLVNNLHARRVLIFYLAADEYGLGLRQGVVRALQRRGVEPFDEIAIAEHSDYSRLLVESSPAGSPDAIVVAARTAEATGILRAVHAALPEVPLILGDGASLDSASIDAEKAAGQPVYGVRWWHPDSGDSVSQQFVQRFYKVTGLLPSAMDAVQYDALMVAAQAVREVGPRPDAIRRYLRELGTARPPYRGVTGPIAFNAGRRINLVMTRVPSGEPIPVDRP